MESNIIIGNSAALTNLYKDSPVIQLLKIDGNEPESEGYKAAITAIENRIETEINRIDLRTKIRCFINSENFKHIAAEIEYSDLEALLLDITRPFDSEQEGSAEIPEDFNEWLCAVLSDPAQHIKIVNLNELFRVLRRETYVKEAVLSDGSPVIHKFKNRLQLIEKIERVFKEYPEFFDRFNIIDNTHIKDVLVCVIGKMEAAMKKNPRLTVEQISFGPEALDRELIEAQEYINQTEAKVNEIAREYSFTRDQIFGMIRDDRFSELNPYIMEDEPGYTLAMLTGLIELLHSEPNNLTSEQYLRIHNLAMCGVMGINESSDEYRPLNDPRKGVEFQLSSLNATKQGVIEHNSKRTVGVTKVNGILDRLRHKAPVIEQKSVAELREEQIPPEGLQSYFIGRYTEIDKAFKFHGARGDDIQGAVLAEKVFQNYYQRIENCSSDRDKISLIAETCQTLDQLHLFTDGNIRTVYLIMNKLLKDIGLRPSILKNPNIFDGYSLNELTEAILAGQIH